MSANSPVAVDFLGESRSSESLVSLHEGKFYTLREFRESVARWAGLLRQLPEQRFALYTENAYPFAIGLFALLEAGKEVWIAGNPYSGTAHRLEAEGSRLIGQWAGQPETDFLPGGYWDGQPSPDAVESGLPPLDTAQTKIVLYTSGSIGEPKPVEKTLLLLAAEIAVLEQLWGGRLGASQILSTVSHQHIYGLLFRVLWPLATGRCFHSTICLNPEMLAVQSQDTDACWVASPAQLKRLQEESPWRALARLTAIFSSGGVLPPEVAGQIQSGCGKTIVEIYGSTETGGIAWREGGSEWSLFKGMALREEKTRWRLFSPYLPNDGGYLLDDNLEMTAVGRFLLQGRADRVVKIEEKRLSLPEMEQRLSTLDSVVESYVMPIRRGRDVVAAVIALSPQGNELAEREGRAALIKHMQNGLKPWFDRIVLPRKWLFVNALPVNTQGKINNALLTALMNGEAEKLPRLLGAVFMTIKIQLEIKIPGLRELVYFPDHFPGYPILPGVIQLAWVAHFGAILFELNDPEWAFSHLEVVKFIKIIQPGERLTLSLNWKAETGDLGFSYASRTAVHSSGRMVYRHCLQPVSE